MENEKINVPMASWATAALALLSAIYVTEADLSEAFRNDIESAVHTAPDEIVLPAALVRPIFLEV